MQLQKAAQGTEVGVPNGRVRRANTTSATPAYVPSIEGKESSQQGGGLKSDVVRHRSVIGSAADKKYLNASLLARPATSFESITPHEQYRAPSFSKQSPERGSTPRRQSSLDAQSTTHIRLSEARARLRSIGNGTTGNLIVPSTGTNVSPVQQKTGLHQLHELLDNAIDEQAELDIVAASARPSPRLKSIASQVELSMTSPPKRQSVEAESSGSPLRRGHSACSSSRPQMPVLVPKSLGSTDGEHTSFSSSQQTSPTKKQRLSTETVLPRSSTDSEPLATPAYPSVCSSPEMKPGHLHPMLPGGQAPSPVKERTAAFEKMMQHDKQIMYEQPHKHVGNAHVKKHWWLASDDHRANHMQGLVKQELNAMANKTDRKTRRDHPTSTRTMTPAPKSGPIPLALPQLISSRGRAVSASSQFEDCFDTAPQSEAALSRLSSRVHSPRTVPKASGAQDIGNETKSPFFRWKPFMHDKKLPAYKKIPASSPESCLEVNAGSDVPEYLSDTTSRLQLRANDLSQAATQNTISQREHGRNTTSGARQSRDVVSASTTRGSTQECHLPQVLPPNRLTLRNTVPTKQGRLSGDVAVHGTMTKQANGADTHREVVQAERRCSFDDMAVDDGKELAVTQSDGSTEEPGEVATESGIEATSSRARSKESTPFPMIPVEARGPASASGPGSPVRGRTASRTLHRQSMVMKNEGGGNGVRVSRSRSKAGNVRVTVEVRTPQGSPVKKNGDKDGIRDGNAKGQGERVVIVTTDVQGAEEE